MPRWRRLFKIKETLDSKAHSKLRTLTVIEVLIHVLVILAITAILQLFW